MKTDITVTALSEMSDEQFIAHCKAYPYGYQWVYGEAFRYAGLRLARLQGLIITKQ